MTSNKEAIRWGGLAVAGALALAAVGVAAVAVGGCRQAPVVASVPAEAKSAIDAAALDGTWFIVASDQSTWTSGEKTSPVLHYRVRAGQDGLLVLEDRASFLEGGQPAQYEGTDTQEQKGSLSFRWRGTGVLSLVTARWHLIDMAPDNSWALVFYEKTMGSPAGVAVLSRKPELGGAALVETQAIVSRHPELRGHADGLQRVAQQKVDAQDGS